MSLFTTFTFSFGSLIALMALIAGWLFRTAAAPLWARILTPALIVGLGCYAPIAVSTMMGYPVSASMADLPEKAELIAFVPHDADDRVDLWLKVTDVPRAYETTLSPATKKVLREAQEAMGHGRRAFLSKKKPSGKQKVHAGDRAGIGDDVQAGDRFGIGDDVPPYVLDQDAVSNLPPKE